MYTFDAPECYAGIRALRLDVSLLRLIGFHDTFFAGNRPFGKHFGMTSRSAIHPCFLSTCHDQRSGAFLGFPATIRHQ